MQILSFIISNFENSIYFSSSIDKFSNSALSIYNISIIGILIWIDLYIENGNATTSSVSLILDFL